MRTHRPTQAAVATSPSALSRLGLATFTLALGAGLWWAGMGTAHAQVVRCTDPASGKVTYTDGECARGTAATEIERRKSEDELARDRQREQEALRAKADRREEALEQRRLEADERAADAAAKPRPQGKNRPDYANSSACQQSREHYKNASDAAADKSMGSRAQLDAAKRQMELDCMGPDAYGRLEASRPSQAPVVTDPYWDRYPYGSRPPPVVRPQPSQSAPTLTRCDVFKCYDAQGYSHPRGQIGEGVPRPVTPVAPSQPSTCRSRGGSAPC